MNKPILVYDNVVSADTITALKSGLVNADWKIHSSMGPPYNGIDIGPAFFNSIPNIPEVDEILSTIHTLTTVEVDRVVRWYVNLYPAGEAHSGQFHTDEDCDITAVFFPHTVQSGGELQFEDGNSIDAIENRMVIFDSSKLHKANVHSDKKFRISFAFKLRGRINER